MKKCPYCFEEIKDEALVCRYCRRELPGYEEEMKKRMMESGRQVQAEGVKTPTQHVISESPAQQDKHDDTPPQIPIIEDMNNSTQTIAQESHPKNDKPDDTLTQAPKPNYQKKTIVVTALLVIVICALFSPLCYFSIQKANSTANPIETDTTKTLEAINKTNVVSELNSTTTPNPTNTEEFTTTPTNYSMINKEQGSSSTKCILDIRLPDRISKEKIKSLAEYLQENEGRNCSPLFIFYFLPDDIPGTDMAWAFSHFNPELEIKINGLDLETKATLEATKPSDNENLVGIWLDTGALPHKIVIKKIGSSYVMTTTYGDGSGETKILAVKAINGEQRLYENPGNMYGDYMVIKSNMYLAFYDDAGFIYELPPE